MFYSKLLYVKKGPLAKIWLAAHTKQKLNKVQVVQTDIPSSVETIVNPPDPMALRLSGHLLLGLVRIYQRKVRYLEDDCSEALTKMKQAPQAARAFDLAPKDLVAQENLITLPHNMDQFEEYDVEWEHELDLQHELDDIAEELALEESDETKLSPEDLDVAGMDMDIPVVEDHQQQEEEKDELGLELEIPLLGEEEGKMDLDYEVELPEIELDMPEGGMEDPEEPGIELDMGFQSPERKGAGEGEGEGEELKAPKRKRVKKRKLAQLNEQVELDRKTLRSNINDPSDLVVERPTIPLSKRPRLDPTELFVTPAALHTSNPAMLEFFREAVEDNLRGDAKRMDDEEEEKQDEQEQEQLDDPFGFDPEVPEVDYGVDPLEHEDGAPQDLDEFPQGGEEERMAQQMKGAGWSRRTVKMYHLLNNTMGEEEGDTSYDQLVPASSARATAAGIFYELLVLKTHNYIDIKQPKAFGDIAVSKTDSFHDPLPQDVASVHA